MSELNLTGLGVALVTPFKNDGSIDFEALTNIINHVLEGGCDYLVVLGTTAETPTLSREEKILVTDFVRGIVDNRVPLIIGIGGNNTKRVCDQLQQRNLDGYSAVLSVTPFYNKPTQEGLYQHYKTISEASPLPVILYNVPGRTGVNLSAHTTLRLAKSSPKIIAIKEASGNLQQCKDIINEAPEGFSLISGDDASTCDLMKIGARGVISVLANAFPAEVRKLVSLCRMKDSFKAEVHQNKLSKLISPLFEDGNPAGVKAALHTLGLCENILRLPLVPVSEHVAKKIKSATIELQKNSDD